MRGHWAEDAHWLKNRKQLGMAIADRSIEHRLDITTSDKTLAKVGPTQRVKRDATVEVN